MKKEPSANQEAADRVDRDPFPSVSLIIPTKNNEREIGAHLEGVLEWVDLVSEVIVVDSSDDATPRICRDMLPDDTTILSSPPGLYQSWNRAIQESHGEFIYIATVGDRISRAGLTQLTTFAAQEDLDMVVSPPEVVGDDSGTLKWPVSELIDEFHIHHPISFEGDELVVVNTVMLQRYGLSSLSGSFASNLTRGSVLKQQPFPVDFGSFGDTAWFARVSGNLKLGLLPERFSSFIVHPSNHQVFSPKELQAKWSTLYQESQRRVTEQCPELAVAMRKKQEFMEVSRKLKSLRREPERGLANRVEALKLSLVKKSKRQRANEWDRLLECRMERTVKRRVSGTAGKR